MTGERYTGADIVEIVPVGPRAAYVRFALSFYNGHSCDLHGVAAAEGADLVYRSRPDPVEPQRCTLRIGRRRGALRWSDPDNSCKSWCGARGSFLNGSVPWSSRRPIRYLARLRASDHYAEALSEWRRAGDTSGQ